MASCKLGLCARTARRACKVFGCAFEPMRLSCYSHCGARRNSRHIVGIAAVWRQRYRVRLQCVWQLGWPSTLDRWVQSICVHSIRTCWLRLLCVVAAKTVDPVCCQVLTCGSSQALDLHKLAAIRYGYVFVVSVQECLVVRVVWCLAHLGNGIFQS